LVQPLLANHFQGQTHHPSEGDTHGHS
jgi:hypothetical protein